MRPGVGALTTPSAGVAFVSQLRLVDEHEDNVKAAQDAGWQAFLWTPRSQLGEVLQRTGR